MIWRIARARALLPASWCGPSSYFRPNSNVKRLMFRIRHGLTIGFALLAATLAAPAVPRAVAQGLPVAPDGVTAAGAREFPLQVSGVVRSRFRLFGAQRD